MKITELSTIDLCKVLAATEQTIGPDAVEVRIMRRELARRGELAERARPEQLQRIEQ